MKTLMVWIGVRVFDGTEDIRVFESFDEIFGLFDYTEQVVVSEKTYKKLKTGNYYAKRHGNTIRAYC